MLNNETVSVTFVSVSVGFNNQFGKAKPNPSDPSYTADVLYFICQRPTPPSTTVNAGMFSGESELVLYLKTSESSPHTWFTGPGNRNSDSKAHARMTQTNATTVRLAWEDQNNQGDHDFNACVVDNHHAAADFDGDRDEHPADTAEPPTSTPGRPCARTVGTTSQNTY